MSSPFEDLKALVVAALHADRVKKFKEEFRKYANTDATEQDVNTFIAHLIRNGNVDKEAQEITTELINKISSRSKNKNVFINTAFTIPLAVILLLFIFIFFTGKVPSLLKEGFGFYSTIISAVILLLVTLIATVIAIANKK